MPVWLPDHTVGASSSLFLTSTLYCLHSILQAKDALPEMPVRLLDPKAGTWSVVECSAEEGEELPKPRGGHSVGAFCCALAAAAVANALFTTRWSAARGREKSCQNPAAATR